MKLDGGERLSSVVGHIEMRDVGFAYPSRPEVSVRKNYIDVVYNLYQ